MFPLFIPTLLTQTDWLYINFLHTCQMSDENWSSFSKQVSFALKETSLIHSTGVDLHNLEWIKDLHSRKEDCQANWSSLLSCFALSYDYSRQYGPRKASNCFNILGINIHNNIFSVVLSCQQYIYFIEKSSINTKG